MPIEINLAGSAALVTGAGAGIGREIAVWLARAGCGVGVNDIDEARAQATVAMIDDEGGAALATPGDVLAPGEVPAIIDRVVDAFGGLDIAVNNVGMMAGRRPASFGDSELDDAWAVIEQNLHATYRCCHAEAQRFISQGRGGTIINVASGEATRPAIGLASYGAAKAGIVHLTTTLAAELGAHGVRVNAIAPGTTYTHDVETALGPELFEAISQSTPMRRVCEPDELARLCVFLASDLARCITGQFILADAGAHLGRALPAR